MAVWKELVWACVQLAIVDNVANPNFLNLFWILRPDRGVNFRVFLAGISHQNELAARKSLHDQSDLFHFVFKRLRAVGDQFCQIFPC